MSTKTRKKNQKQSGSIDIGKQIRFLTLEMSARSKAGETGSSLSISDILAVLYFKILRLDPKKPEWPLRDRFILSKGHGAAAYYAALALRGFFPLSHLEGHRVNGGRFHAHPSRGAAPGIEVSTGSLGHGLSIGAGMAEAIKKTKSKVYVLLGDGECNEGSVWEAARHIGSLQMKNIVAIVDHNNVQGYPLAREKKKIDIGGIWKACGWEVLRVNGHDARALERALKAAAHAKKPFAVIAKTVSGKGVPHIEHTQGAHYYVPDRAAVEAMAKNL
jgi:transketolase